MCVEEFLFLFTTFAYIKAVSRIALETTQSEDNRKTAMIDDVKKTQSEQSEGDGDLLSGVMIYLLSCHNK